MKIKQIATGADGRRVFSRENCPKCYGRGYVGFSRPVRGTVSGVKIGPVMCDCVFAMPRLGTQPAAQIERKMPWWHWFAVLAESIRKKIFLTFGLNK